MAQIISPLQTLTDFFRRCKAPAPTVTFGTVEGQHACLLECCSTVWEGSAIEVCPVRGNHRKQIDPCNKLSHRGLLVGSVVVQMQRHLATAIRCHEARDEGHLQSVLFFSLTIQARFHQYATEKFKILKGTTLGLGTLNKHATKWLPNVCCQ